MTQYRRILLTLAVVILFPSLVKADIEILPIPARWEFPNSRWTAWVRESPPRDKCIRFIIPKHLAEHNGVRAYSEMVPIKMNVPYRISLDVKVKHGLGAVIVWVKGYKTLEAKESYRAQLRCYHKGSGDWNRYERTFIIKRPQGIRWARVMLFGYLGFGTGLELQPDYPPLEMYFDNISLSETESVDVEK